MERLEWQLAGVQETNLFVREWMPEEEKAKAVVCLVHGMGEHGDRYSHVATRLTAAGFAVIALDQHGHGRSPGKRGHLLSLSAAINDVALLIEESRRKYAGIPIFLYGHSMGGNVAINCALRLKPPIAGLVLTSPWLRLAFKPHPAVEWFGRRLAGIVPTLQQSTGLLPGDLFRPGYFEAAPIVGDPLCHTRITLHTFSEISNGGEWALAHADTLHVPMLLMHGSADRITSYEASARLAEMLGKKCDWICRKGGMHELHNDLEAEQSIKEITIWLERQL